MRIEKPDIKILRDGGGDIVVSDLIKDLYTILRSQDYNSLSFNYNQSKFISLKILNSEFEPVENSKIITYSNDKSFIVDYGYWKHKILDFYISGMTNDSTYTDEEEDIYEGYYYIKTIYYKEDTDFSPIIEYLNTNVTDKLPTSNKIDIIVQTQQGYTFKEYSLKSTHVDVDTMYNDDFRPVYDHIVNKLNNGNKGVVLLYGDPGTGKTNLLRHLTTVVTEKFVFVPINMIEHVSSPSFISDLITNKGKILVIEDCENYIQDRKTSHTTVVSPLLQITDGILSDLMDIKIICTFNTDLTKVDEALLREGRLIAEYEFKELSDEKAEALAGKKVEGKKTLANIFNQLTYKANKKEEVKIGFNR